jgi:hypothetical protein
MLEKKFTTKIVNNKFPSYPKPSTFGRLTEARYE